ncbi:hypothetical protein [Paraburkholderia sp. J8-2]|uniref:hypothetical protein n=1 Tax=Paraburkholderia sp. J8-2 TaxID=2805440 RepID=UPI002AB5FBD3|nr:hypothetical protein [Paraburkholderia sp. J8-2]
MMSEPHMRAIPAPLFHEGILQQWVVSKAVWHFNCVDRTDVRCAALTTNAVPRIDRDRFDSRAGDPLCRLLLAGDFEQFLPDHTGCFAQDD